MVVVLIIFWLVYCWTFKRPLIKISLSIITLPLNDASPDAFNVVITAVGVVNVPVNDGDAKLAFKLNELSTTDFNGYEFNDISMLDLTLVKEPSTIDFNG